MPHLQIASFSIDGYLKLAVQSEFIYLIYNLLILCISNAYKLYIIIS